MDDKFDIQYIVQISPVYVINTEKKIIDLSLLFFFPFEFSNRWGDVWVH